MILISGILGVLILLLIWIIKAIDDAPIIDGDVDNEYERFFSESYKKKELNS